jgi:hypothetical protein
MWVKKMRLSLRHYSNRGKVVQVIDIKRIQFYDKDALG